MSSESDTEPEDIMVNGKRHYLVTYSQCNREKFPTRESFGAMVAERFNNTTKGHVKVLHWACGLESHADGGFHYHCSVKLNGVKRWKKIRESIERNHGIQVNFSDSDEHNSYISAYRYVAKQDKEFVLSEGHLDLSDAKSPKPKKAIAANRRKSKGSKGKKRKSTGSRGTARKKLTLQKLESQEIGMLCRRKNIRNYAELLALSEERRLEGLTDVSKYMFDHTRPIVEGVIALAWEQAESLDKLKKMKKNRVEILFGALEEPCLCRGEWLLAACEILQLNNIDREEFTSAIYQNLEFGRAKYRNVMIIGKRNRAKSFIIKPLNKLYDNIFQNPAMHKYDWVGAQDASIIILQDFRWKSDLIDWSDFLRLLEEDEPVRLPAPRNLYREDVLINTQVAFFATRKGENQVQVLAYLFLLNEYQCF